MVFGHKRIPEIPAVIYPHLNNFNGVIISKKIIRMFSKEEIIELVNLQNNIRNYYENDEIKFAFLTDKKGESLWVTITNSGDQELITLICLSEF